MQHIYPSRTHTQPQRGCAGLVSALVLLAAIASPALADEPVRAQSDTASQEVRPGTATLPACPRTRANSLRPLKLRQVIVRARARLARQAPAGVRRFNRSPYAQSHAKAEVGSAIALAADQPGAALAASLRAVQLRPSNPRYLLNASTLLTRLGDARGAMALVNRARRLPEPARSPLGLNHQAQLALAAGNAYLIAGRYMRAIRALQRAVHDPLLAEARMSLSIAHKCAGNSTASARWFEAAQRRTGNLALLDVGGAKVPNVVGLVDLSRGTTVPPISFVLPVTAEQAATRVEWLLGLEERAQSQVDRLRAEAFDLRQRIAARYPAVSDRIALFDAIPTRAWSADIAPLIQRDIDAGSDVWRVFGGPDMPPCHYYDDWSKFRQAWYVQFKTAQDLGSEYHRIYTGLAANFKNKLATAYFDLVAKEAWWWSSSDYGTAATFADGIRNEMWPTEGEHHCEKPLPVPEETGDPTDPAFTTTESCPGALSAVKFSVDLVFVSVAADCEQLELEISSTPKGLGWIGAFGSVQYAWRGQVTIFAGPQARFGWSDENLGASLGARTGLYVTFWPGTNRPVDAGLRVEASASGSVGPLELSVLQGTWDFAFH